MNVFEFSSFIVQPNEFRIIKLGHTIDVEPQVFETLLLLIEQRSRVVTKGELLEKIWQGRVVSNHVITRIIYQLRKILDNKDEKGSHIRTVRGRGYQFVAKVNESNHVGELDSLVNSVTSPFEPARTKSKWVMYFLILAVICLATIGSVVITKPLSNIATSDLKPKLYPVVSVLPIEVKAGNEELSILVQSLIDYLTNQLAVNLNVKVIHPDSLISLGTEISDLSGVQKATRSDFIIQGFVEPKSNQKINLHLRLFKRNTAGKLVLFPLGAFEFPYPKSAKELSALYKQRKITIKSIVEIIKPGISVNNDGNFETEDPEAYRLVIAAHHMSRKDDCMEMQRAEQLLLQAVDKDEKFVYAYLQLFSNYYKRVWICGESTEFHQKGLAMAEIVDRLAPGLYSAMSIRRSTILVESNQVEKAYEFSQNADWNNPDVIYDKSYSLRYAGFLNANSINLDRILQLDPFFFNEKPIKQAPNSLLYQNRFDEHLKLLAEPGNAYHDYFRGLNLYLTGNSDQAINVLQAVVKRTPNDFFGQFSQALLHVIKNEYSGALSAIGAIVELREEKKHTDGEMTYKLVQLYAMAGEDQLALKYLQIAVDQGFFPMNYFLSDPALNSIQNSPLFSKIINQATHRHESFAKRFGLEPETKRG